MNAFLRIAAATCLAASMLASQPTRAGSDPSRSRVVIDCGQPRLPTQREAGELLGQHNSGQVYASRAALMAEARRLCLHGSAQTRRVAFEAPSAPPAPSVLPPQERRIADDRRGY